MPQAPDPDMLVVLVEMVETALSSRNVDVAKLRADLGAAALMGLDPRLVYAQALHDAARPDNWPAAPPFDDLL
jgi:hypothetical protein